MKDKDFMEVRVDVKDAEVLEKLDILRLERGISSNSFIIGAIVDKLRRDGYLQDGVREHMPKEHKKELTDAEQLRNSFMKIQMRRN